MARRFSMSDVKGYDHWLSSLYAVTTIECNPAGTRAIASEKPHQAAPMKPKYRPHNYTMGKVIPAATPEDIKTVKEHHARDAMLARLYFTHWESMSTEQLRALIRIMDAGVVEI